MCFSHAGCFNKMYAILMFNFEELSCWFHGPSIISAASNVIFWTFFRAKTCCVVCTHIVSATVEQIWRKKMSEKPHSIRLLRWFNFSQSGSRKNNRKAFEGASMEPTMRALMSRCVIPYEFQSLQVLFDTWHDYFGCLEAGLQLFFWATWFCRLIKYMPFWAINIRVHFAS